MKLAGPAFTIKGTTTAVKDGDHYVINGSKIMIGNGTVGTFLLVYCLTHPDVQKKTCRHSILMVETDRPGYKADPMHGKMGLRASDTAAVYFNNVRVQPEIVIRTNQFGVAYTTPPFTLASVNAQLGLGPDNIVSLRGLNYSAEGGGGWMGIDYVKINAAGDNTPLKFVASTASGGKLTLTWTGTGTLESAPTVKGQWNTVTNASSGMTIAPTGAAQYYRLRQ